MKMPGLDSMSEDELVRELADRANKLATRSTRALGEHDGHGWRAALSASVVNDPNVWSGRALQEDLFELGDMRSCINVSGL